MERDGAARGGAAREGAAREAKPRGDASRPRGDASKRRRDASSVARAVGELVDVAARLRAPDGCPWDREQTHRSLRAFLVEEAYEALAAIDAGDAAALRDELGDVLFQVVIHAQLAREAGTFDLADVARGASAKLIRRHPHVFAGTPLAEGDVLAQWERIKAAERGDEGRDVSVLEGLPPGMPALFAAERLLERAARVGISPEPRAKSADPLRDQTTLGDALFGLVALAREAGLDAEAALREANERFAERVRRSQSQEASAEPDGAASMRPGTSAPGGAAIENER